jgi:hypothetical protein
MSRPIDSTGFQVITAEIAAAAVRVCEGEIRQMEQRQNWQLSEQEYIETITDKSASLFNCCCTLGGLLSRASQDQVQALADFGLNAGIAFQITDDLLDLVGDQNKIGNGRLKVISTHPVLLLSGACLRKHPVKGFDFNGLSVDDEGYLYALNVFYAGSCPNNWSEGLWPHSSSLATPYALGPGNGLTTTRSRTSAANWRWERSVTKTVIYSLTGQICTTMAMMVYNLLVLATFVQRAWYRHPMGKWKKARYY